MNVQASESALARAKGVLELQGFHHDGAEYRSPSGTLAWISDEMLTTHPLTGETIPPSEQVAIIHYVSSKVARRG